MNEWIEENEKRDRMKKTTQSVEWMNRRREIDVENEKQNHWKISCCLEIRGV